MTRKVKRYIVEYDTTQLKWKEQRYHCAYLEVMVEVAYEGYKCDNEYMDWYIPRTYPYIIPPNADGLRACLRWVRGYLDPCPEFQHYQIAKVQEAVRRSLEDIRPFDYYS